MMNHRPSCVLRFIVIQCVVAYKIIKSGSIDKRKRKEETMNIFGDNFVSKNSVKVKTIFFLILSFVIVLITTASIM